LLYRHEPREQSKLLLTLAAIVGVPPIRVVKEIPKNLS
jgi:hypothetical protein